MEDVYWSGDSGDCDFCQQTLTTEFIDGKTVAGPWAKMCPLCALDFGVGVGTGKGQVYQRQANGAWKKVRG